MGKPNVAFICVHNSCRSQMAEALGKKLCADAFESYSAGTETKPQINQDAVRLMKRVHGIDMEKTQYSKLLSELPQIDIVITLLCFLTKAAVFCAASFVLTAAVFAADAVFCVFFCAFRTSLA